MKDVLLSIGSLIKGAPDNEEQQIYMIIGKRIINHETMRCWDYVCVPFPKGLTRVISNNNTFENFYYCNHHEIDEIVEVNECEKKEYV